MCLSLFAHKCKVHPKLQVYQAVPVIWYVYVLVRS